MPARRYEWNPKVACRTLDGTAFILHNSRMVSLNEVGSRVWELFEHGSTLDAVAQTIADEFEVTPETALADANHFVDELLARELLVPTDNDSGS